MVNFAQGQLGVVAAVFLVKLFYDFGFNYWVALVISVALAAAVGALSELVLRRLFNRPRVLVMVATIGLSQVLFLFTVFPFIRPKKLYRPFPVPIDWTFHIGTFLFSPGDVMTLIVAPVVVVALAAFIRCSSWGLAMRAMAENAESARLSGVWVRRTSTVAWTLAGALSAVTAVLASPGQTSALTDVLSPDLLLLALLAALIGAMVSLPVAFIAGIGVGVVVDLLQWNITNPDHRHRPPSSSSSSSCCWRRCWCGPPRCRRGPGWGSDRRGPWARRPSAPPATPCARQVGCTGVGALPGGGGPAALRHRRGPLLSHVPDLHLRDHRPVARPSSPAGRARCRSASSASWPWGPTSPPMSAPASPSSSCCPLAGAATALVSILVGLTALRIRGLYLAVSTLGFALFMQTSVLATPCFTLPLIHRTDLLGAAQPRVDPDLPAVVLRAQPVVGTGLRLVLPRRPRPVGAHGPGLARPGRGPPAHRRARQRDRRRFGRHPGGADQAAGLRPVRLHGRLRRGLPGLRHRALQHRHLRPHLLHPGRLHGGDRRSRLDPRALCSGPSTWRACPPSSAPPPTVEFLTSGAGLLVFILYLPGGMAEVLHRFGDLTTMAVENLRARRRPAPPGDPSDGAAVDPAADPVDPHRGQRSPAGALSMADP